MRQEVHAPDHQSYLVVKRMVDNRIRLDVFAPYFRTVFFPASLLPGLIEALRNEAK